MKKIIALALALILCLALAACGRPSPSPRKPPRPSRRKRSPPRPPQRRSRRRSRWKTPRGERRGVCALAATVELVRSLIGQPVQELYDAVGQPLSSDYASSCLVSGGGGRHPDV